MIADTFIKRPVTAMVVSLVIVLIGSIAVFTLPVSQYPDITPPSVTVSGTYTGADAQTVEENVTTPLEVQINGSPGMTYISSSSTSDGRSTITVNYALGTNPDIAALDVQNRVSIATPQLPDDVKRLGITTRKRNPSILMLVALYSPKGTHDVTFVDNYTNIFVRDALLRVPGVGDIFSRADDFSMRIWLNPDKMAQMNISTNDVVNALQEQNVQVAAGSIGAPPQNSLQAFEYTILTNGRLKNVEQFNDVIIRADPQKGSIVYLKDIGRVQLGKFNYNGNSFVDGKRASYLLVYQSPGSNALDVADGIYTRLKELKKGFPEDVDYMVPFESVSVVKVSIDEVVTTLLIALGLVILVVFLFLQSWRATLIPVLAIPVSIIGTFALFIPLGFTVNTLTLFGLVLAIGIVVDDAIIVVEATQHYIDAEKLPAREAAHRAMKDISGPVVAIAFILAAVFVPVGFIPGLVGRLYQQFAITIAISVLISAFVALSLTPALCALLLKPMHLDHKSKGLNKFFFRFNNWFRKLTGNYTANVNRAIKFKPVIILLLVGIYAATVFLFNTKPTGFIPQEDEGRLYITFELPEGSSTRRSLDVMDSMMAIMKTTPGIDHYAALGGINVVTFAFKSNDGTIFTQLKPWDQRKDKALQLQGIIKELQKRFSVIEGANIILIPPPAIPGLGATGGFTFELQKRESTDDIKAFSQVVQNFLVEANKRKELNRPFSFFNARTPAYQVDIDREKCKKMGVALSDVFQTLQTFLGSRYVNDFTIYGRSFRVVAQADSSFRGNIEEMKNYFVRNQEGTMVPLSTLFTYKVVENASMIPHFNLFRSAEFNGSAAEGYSSGQAINTLRDVAAKVLPDGYGYEFSGLSREEINAGSITYIIFALSVTFVFLFLAALYESWSVPLAVLLAVPIGAFGAIIALTCFSKLSNNVYAQIGLITLIGLAAKNAILIVEYAKERVDRGIPVVAATLDAVSIRLRPIIMTSMAFILGVLPLAFAAGAGAQARSTIGWTVLGGMLAATLLAIVIVPVLFVIITHVAYGKKKLEELQKNASGQESGNGN